MRSCRPDQTSTGTRITLYLQEPQTLSELFTFQGREPVFRFCLFLGILLKKSNFLSICSTAHGCFEQQPQHNRLWEGAEDTPEAFGTHVAESDAVTCGSLNRLGNSSSYSVTSLIPTTTHLKTPFLGRDIKHPDISSGNYVTP